MAPTSHLDGILARCRSWDDFVAELQRLENTTTKGHLFERLTQLYLQTEPTYASKLRHVWWHNGNEVPATIRRQLRLPKADEGIDLVAQTRSGEFWAVQAKYRHDPRTTITRESLGTFHSLAFAHCVGFSLGVVAHTTAKPISKRDLLDGVTALGLDAWLGLTDEHWTLIHHRLEGEAVRPRAYSPRKHQERAIAAAVEHFLARGAERGRLIMPCGTGKSLTAYWIARELKAKTVVVAVPSLALIKQSVADWTREFLAEGIKPDWLCVCSSADVGKLESDDLVASTYETGLDTTTQVEKIAAFLSRRSASHRIVFVTYQSSRRFCEAAQLASCTFDLAILDEAHKTVGAKNKAFATLLHEENLDVRHRVSMTATERVLEGGHSDDVLSMDDDAEEYGERFFELSFQDAIEGVYGDPPLICDYRILTLTVSETRIRELVEERRFVDVDERLGEVDAQEVAVGLALKKAAKERGVRHAISFHRSIAAAKRFAAQQNVFNADPDLGPPMTNLHISSKNSVGERATLLKEFPEHPRSLLTNARCLTEGVNVPEVDCVVFANPKQSVVDIVQAAGRAMRLHRDKEVGYILLPLIVPDGISLEEFSETTEFRQVARTVMALSTQDERIAEEFRLVDRRPRPSDRIVQFDGDVPVGTSVELSEFFDELGTLVWKRVARANWRAFEEARKFAHSLSLQSEKEWRDWTKTALRPVDIPVGPSYTYRNQGWNGWGDFLGTGQLATRARTFRPFAAARHFVRGLGLRTYEDWKGWAKSDRRPEDIPWSPDREYAGEWVSWPDFLGSNSVGNWNRAFLPFAEARAFSRSLGLTTQYDWNQWSKSGERPENIPSNPDREYAGKGWVGYGDWLGTGRTRFGRYRAFAEARDFVRTLGLTDHKAWQRYSRWKGKHSGQPKRPRDIPSNPQRTYKDDWISWADWLGTGE